MHFVGYLYITDLINARKMERVKVVAVVVVVSISSSSNNNNTSMLRYSLVTWRQSFKYDEGFQLNILHIGNCGNSVRCATQNKMGG